MRLATAAIFGVVSSMIGLSQPPSPAPGVTTQQQEKQTGDKQPIRTPDQSVSTQPLVVINQRLPAVSPRAKQEQTNEGTRPSMTDWIVAIFTAILAGVSFFQWRAISKQAKIMTDGLIETRSAAEAAKETARAATEATKLTRETFVLSQRPRVIVRNVSVADPMLFYNPNDISIRGSFFIANAGATKAHVVAIYCTVIRGQLPMIPPHSGSGASSEIPVDISLPPGKGTTRPFEDTLPGVPQFPAGSNNLDYDERAATRSSDNPIHVLGRITYKDDLGTIRSTAFCRKWNPVLQRFFSIPDPDYEHAE